MMVYMLFLVMSCTTRSILGKNEESPEILDSQAISYKRKLNESICLPCRVKRQYNDNRKCLFYWRKNETLLLDSPKYRVKTDRQCLLIQNIRSSDHATYICIAESPLGKAQAVRNLIVTNRDLDAPIPEVKRMTQILPTPVPVPPFFRDNLKITDRLIHKYFYLGKRGKLKCAIVGSPRPKIKWFHNGVSLEGSTLVHIRPRSFVLIIEPFTKKHVGNYTCVASNGMGNKSMAFIVSVKVGDPNPPLPTTGERTVSEGENITLQCSRPAKKVKYLTWDVPKRIRIDQEKARHRGRDPSRFSPPPLRPRTNNASVVKLLHLYNISNRKHAGEYRCLALYKRTREPVPVKIVHLTVRADDKIALPRDDSPNNEILLVKIAVPVMGSVLTLFVVIICFRCRRKTSLNNPAKAKTDDDDDALSMQILPSIPTGTLRIHKSLQESTGNETSRIPDVVSSGASEKIDTATVCGKVASKPLSSSPHKHSYENSCKARTKRLPKSKCTNTNSNTKNMNIISNNSSENIYAACDTDEQMQTDTLDNLDDNKKLTYKTNELEGVAVANDLHSSCCSVGNKVRTLDSPVLHSEGDLLLQREIKNWEPLIRESKSLLREKTVNDNNLLRSQSDCSREIIT